MSEKWQMRIAQLERENRLLISRALRAERRVEAMGFAAQVEERARSRQAGTAHDVDRLLERIAAGELLLTKANEEKNQKTLELIKTEKQLRQNQLKVSFMEQEVKDKADEIRRISVVQAAMDRATPLLSPTIRRTPPRTNWSALRLETARRDAMALISLVQDLQIEVRSWKLSHLGVITPCALEGTRCHGLLEGATLVLTSTPTPVRGRLQCTLEGTRCTVEGGTSIPTPSPLSPPSPPSPPVALTASGEHTIEWSTRSTRSHGPRALKEDRVPRDEERRGNTAPTNARHFKPHTPASLGEEEEEEEEICADTLTSHGGQPLQTYDMHVPSSSYVAGTPRSLLVHFRDCEQREGEVSRLVSELNSTLTERCAEDDVPRSSVLDSGGRWSGGGGSARRDGLPRGGGGEIGGKGGGGGGGGGGGDSYSVAGDAWTKRPSKFPGHWLWYNMKTGEVDWVSDHSGAENAA